MPQGIGKVGGGGCVRRGRGPRRDDEMSGV